MTLFTALTLIVTGIFLFAAALSVQIRWLGGHALRKALEAAHPGTPETEARLLVAAALSAETSGDSRTHWLRETYPGPVAQLRLARRALIPCLVLAFGALAAGRIAGVI